jgi:ABC-type lipoprotein release transport system permease subunit
MALPLFFIGARRVPPTAMRGFDVFLTLLGMIVGVASLITMVGVGEGAQAEIAEEIRSFGA